MILSNFAFSPDHIGVNYGERYFDLHNNFDFVRYAKQQDDEVLLLWRRAIGDWVPEWLPQTFTIAIAGVTYFDVRGRPSDALDEFGFFDSDTLGKVDYQGTTWAQDGHDLLVLRFVGGGELALRGKTASASSGE
jgi:hypothetical protein